jgi:alpha-L-fucosidase 2
MEWSEDFDEPEPGHRHISHLYALHPSMQIMRSHPELKDACRVTLDRRLSSGGGHTGWSRAWITNFFARLGDGDRALENLNALLAKSTLPNLFDNHPPFQIDGNFGGCAAFCEMLIFGDGDTVTLLPALPSDKEWQSGEFRGMRVRGNLEADCRWENGKVTAFTLRSHRNEEITVTVKYNGEELHTTIAPNGIFSI